MRVLSARLTSPPEAKPALVSVDCDVTCTARALAREAEGLRGLLVAYFRRRIRNGSEVDDLVQDVFARIIARASDSPIEHLQGYAFQTAASVLADRARRRTVRHAAAHVPFDPQRHGGTEIDPARSLIARDDLRRATAALFTLPERTRMIFVLKRLDGRTSADVAAQFGISVSAVEKHMVRAVLRLSMALGDGS